MDFLLDPQIWASFLTLTLMEIVLGIDNVIFVSIVANRLSPERRAVGRVLDLSGARVMRVALLFAVTCLVGLTAVAIEILGHGVSWRATYQMAGGQFLRVKGTPEAQNRVHTTGRKTGRERGG